jgi:transcriptional regulator with XRE-family HTH domain
MAIDMRRTRRPPAVITGVREANAIAANLGRDTKATRKRRLLTQAALGELVELGQSQVSHLERGHGARTSIQTWVAIGMALDRPIAIGFSRDVVEPLSDAGHLAAMTQPERLAAIITR